ncbi:hypothetical protein [Roseateles aquatilis]|uniref:hypothetical protein n=1 Tax=Roseateles aquatilis TaxID=431061 RepID=UPI0011328487|nr:hypothetical protein [Roseateles aquatilis]
MNVNSFTARQALAASTGQDRLMVELQGLPPDQSARFADIRRHMQVNNMILKASVDQHQGLLRKIVNEIR